MISWLECWQSRLSAGVEEATFRRLVWLRRHNVKQQLCSYINQIFPGFAERPYSDAAPLWGGVGPARGDPTAFTCDRRSITKKTRHSCSRYGHPEREEKVVGLGGRARSYRAHIWAGCLPEVSYHNYHLNKASLLLKCYTNMHWPTSKRQITMDLFSQYSLPIID